MNIDNGDIRPWDSLTPEEKESGRWVKLSDDELAMAERVYPADRKAAMAEIFRREIEDRRFPGDFKKSQ